MVMISCAASLIVSTSKAQKDPSTQFVCYVIGALRRAESILVEWRALLADTPSKARYG